MEINRALIDYCFFGDFLSTNQGVGNLTQNIVFSDSLTYSPTIISTKDVLNLFDYTSVSGVKRRISLSNSLNLRDGVKRKFNISLTDTVTFFEPTSAIDHLLLTQTLIAQASIPIIDNILFSETLFLNRNRHLFLNQILIFNSHTFAFKIPGGFNSGSPGTPIIDQIYTDPLPITPHTFITFNSLAGPQFILKRPSFGNQYKTQYNHIQSETRGRALVLAGMSSYEFVQSIKSLNFTIEYMTQDEGQGLMNFLNQNYGIPMYFIDHENITYFGFVTTSELELTQRDKNNYSTSFDFEIVP